MVALFSLVLKHYNLTGSASNNKSLREQTEVNLLDGKARVVCEWIKDPDLQQHTRHLIHSFIQGFM